MVVELASRLLLMTCLLCFFYASEVSRSKSFKYCLSRFSSEPFLRKWMDFYVACLYYSLCFGWKPWSRQDLGFYQCIWKSEIFLEDGILLHFHLVLFSTTWHSDREAIPRYCSKTLTQPHGCSGFTALFIHPLIENSCF